MKNVLDLQRAPETLHGRIVELPLSLMETRIPVVQQVPDRTDSALAAATRMMRQSWRRET